MNNAMRNFFIWLFSHTKLLEVESFNNLCQIDKDTCWMYYRFSKKNIFHFVQFWRIHEKDNALDM